MGTARERGNAGAGPSSNADGVDGTGIAAPGVANALRAAKNRTRGTSDGRGKRKKFNATNADKTPAAEQKRTIPTGEACDALPMDWTLKSSVRFTSETCFHWTSCLGAVPVSQGLRAYSGGEAAANTTSIEDVQKALTRASYSCAYPADPLSATLIRSMTSDADGRAWLKKRHSTWTDALVSVYGLLRVRQCYAFYVVYAERTILFCAPGVGGVTDGGYAVITNSNLKIRRALMDAQVDFSSADEEALAIENAKKERTKIWRPEDEVEEQNDLLGALAGDEASRAAAAKNMATTAEVTAQLAQMDKPSTARRRAAQTIICRGAIAVNGLLNVLIEASGGDPGSADSTVRDVPLLLAPVPFAHSVMKPVALRAQRNTVLSRKDTNKDAVNASLQVIANAKQSSSSSLPAFKTMYTAETERDECVPPWSLARMCAALTSKHDDLSSLCITVPQSFGLNVGVLAAREFSETNTKHRETALVRECAYYDESETKRIMAPPPLGSDAIKRIDCYEGKYYVY